MTKEIYSDSGAVADRAAADAVEILKELISKNGRASWALAGGTSPMAAYAKLAEDYADALDWSKVTLLIGDERCVPLDHQDSNWGQISKVLFANEKIAEANKLTPQAELGPIEGAEHYQQLLHDQLAEANIDLLWLGVGEDGHTLSLFPGHSEIDIKGQLVLPVHDSPKPPPERITLSYEAAVSAGKLVIFAVGAAKKEALAQVHNDPSSLPIGIIAAGAEDAGNEVVWLFDKAATD